MGEQRRREIRGRGREGGVLVGLKMEKNIVAAVAAVVVGAILCKRREVGRGGRGHLRRGADGIVEMSRGFW